MRFHIFGLCLLLMCPSTYAEVVLHSGFHRSPICGDTAPQSAHAATPAIRDDSPPNTAPTIKNIHFVKIQNYSREQFNTWREDFTKKVLSLLNTVPLSEPTLALQQHWSIHIADNHAQAQHCPDYLNAQYRLLQQLAADPRHNQLVLAHTVNELNKLYLTQYDNDNADLKQLLQKHIASDTDVYHYLLKTFRLR